MIKHDVERAAAAFERFSAAMEGKNTFLLKQRRFLSRIFGGFGTLADQYLEDCSGKPLHKNLLEAESTRKSRTKTRV